MFSFGGGGQTGFRCGRRTTWPHSPGAFGTGRPVVGSTTQPAGQDRLVAMTSGTSTRTHNTTHSDRRHCGELSDVGELRLATWTSLANHTLPNRVSPANFAQPNWASPTNSTSPKCVPPTNSARMNTASLMNSAPPNQASPPNFARLNWASRANFAQPNRAPAHHLVYARRGVPAVAAHHERVRDQKGCRARSGRPDSLILQ